MRSSGLGVGALAILITCAAFTAVNAQEDDKSYLPPKSMQGKAEPPLNKPAQAQTSRYASAQPKSYGAAAQPQRRRIAGYRRRYGRERYAYNQPFFFGW